MSKKLKRDEKNIPDTKIWYLDENNKKYMHTQKYIPSIRQGWNDASLSRPYSRFYDNSGLTYQLSYEIGRSAASHWIGANRKRILWISQKEIPSFVKEAFNLADTMLPPDIDPNLEPVNIPDDEQVSVY